MFIECPEAAGMGLKQETKWKWILTAERFIIVRKEQRVSGTTISGIYAEADCR